MDESPFVMSAEHLLFQEETRRFARKELMPGYLERSFSEEFPAVEARKLADAGLTSLLLGEEHSGQGADLVSFGLAAEEVAYADPNCAFLVLNTNILVKLLSGHPSPALRDRARLLASGEQLGCLALTEPGVGSDAGALTTQATRCAEGWRLSGEKTSVSLAPHADVALVIARTRPGPGSSGIAAFLVELGDPSVSRQRFRDSGVRPLGRGSISMADTFVPDDHVVAEPGTGFPFIMREFDLSRTIIALMATGPARRALDSAIDYSRQRRSFGKPLAAHQGVSFDIAEHATYVEGVRALAFQTLGLRQARRPHTAQAAMLKWWAPKVAFDAIQACIVLHGHIAWSDEMPLQSLLRDVSGYQIGDGTPQIQKLVIARHLIGREATS
ncbi:acyl-CoA dehydrogenase family protein [Nonomuraea jabiensis]|uniref:acyl-CoA dehydrogenase family protein n=1 Tax=Nonomuraea jabiensis TaxID=882448 RepID=UPI0034327D5C